MTFKDLENLILIFYKNSFDFSLAIKLFGPVKNDTLPHRLVLSPLDPRFEFIFLERMTIPLGPAGTTFLAGISIRQRAPLEVDFKRLEQLFGAPEKLPRLKPSQAVMYQFKIQNFDYPGTVLLGVPPGHEEDIRPVTDLILRRFYPGT